MIKLLLLDVDGTLTDGKITFIDSIESASLDSVLSSYESKSFNIQDGLGIVAWLKMGLEVAIISGRESNLTKLRAKELGITRVFMGVGDKSSIAHNIISGLNLSKDEVACIGDDVNDLGMFKECGLCFVPNNANELIKQKADVILQKAGGEGAVREMIDFIISRDKDLLKEFLSLYE